LQVTIPDTQKSPVIAMSQWVLNGGLPDGMSLGGDADLEDPSRGRVVWCARAAFILSLMKSVATSRSGKQVVRLALSWQDQG
jgi:DNA recombination-dependent growth factor C